MRQKTALCVLLALLCWAGVAAAELQNIEVGGEIRIGGNFISRWNALPGPVAVRIPPVFLRGRSVGEFASGVPVFGGLGAVSPYRWDNRGRDLTFLEQRTRLGVRALFTEEVSAFIELEAYDFWGANFRSNYLTGTDARLVGAGDLEVYQAYVEAKEMWGTPLSLRVGRQELAFGDQWLVGPKDFGPSFTGRSFDALRLTYAVDKFSVDAFWSKLAERSAVEQDGDTDFYGIYASYKAFEELTLDAFWFFIRDASDLEDTRTVAWYNWLEKRFGLDDYHATELHTIGLRAAGACNGFDYYANAAYQFGDVPHVGFGFKPLLYGDDDAEASIWAGKIGLGYTFDVKWQPRIHIDYNYYGGEDNRDITYLQWQNPFKLAESSVSFNRLFSNQMYNGFFDLNNNLSNVHIYQAGVMAHPTPQIDVMLELGYFVADEAFDRPRTVFGRAIPFFSFWTEESDDDLGLVSDIVAIYHYSEDLMFLLHWSHLFAGDGLRDGNFTAWNGLAFDAGSDNDDGDYVRFETVLKF